ncbi:thiol-disulfide isomerase/thioredoxin [Kibdelosporangium banguiense]|uniref:Thiol-disulfide isomerase/thioredoxin n=1 Tax=Kibdelosporangium banguiense TaxID=1365924 RepID=A0ABS4TBJ1_9PSEU|nr:TlpA disulfide reductase family protein [Kibdelosporangium banguiense]MBP2321455.1 thiol-disulfide isomerase/thioredoxin [Kibdelosporangium banguiense]
MSVKVRWALVALVLVVAGTIALWPRTDEAPKAAPSPPPVKTDLPTCSRQGVALATVQGVTATCLADGQNADVAQVFAGPVLVNVWATWCAPCQEELPVLAQYAAKPGAIPVVTVAVESEQATAIAMLTNLKVRVPSLLDQDGSVKRALKPTRLPASYLIDAQGLVNFINDPPVFHSVADVEKAVGQ